MRNKCLDGMKAIAACMVIFIHIDLPGQTGVFVEALSRFAVPFFFMISGYFCYYNGKDASDRIPGKIVHIVKLMIFAMAFYFIWEISKRLVTGENLYRWIREVTDRQNIMKLLLYNSTSPLRGHLWFLPALIYCYMLDYLIERFHLRKIAFWCIPALLGGLLWRGYFCSFFGYSYRIMEYRNWFFTGMSFYLLGQMFHEYLYWFRRKIGYITLILIMTVGIGMTIWECSQFGAKEIYVGSILICISIFLLTVLWGTRIQMPEVLTAVGAKLAFPVYLFHLAVGDMMRVLAVAGNFEDNLAYLWIRPFAVCVFTIVMIALVYRGCSFWKKYDIVGILSRQFGLWRKGSPL